LAESSSERVEKEVVKVEMRWVNTQIKTPVLSCNVRGSSETRPRARHEQKIEEKREEKGDDANASRLRW